MWYTVKNKRNKGKKVEILFEDKSVIVCIKPRGILSQSDIKGGENMIDNLSAITKSEIYPLHRLDKEVGGVMVYAKTKKAAAILSRDIAEHKFSKEYIVLIHSKPKESSGEMRDLLFKDSRKNKSFVVRRQRKGVKEALLEYSLLESNGEFSICLVKLHTGRTHQIRVQFASRKMALAGDKKYGAKDDYKTIGLWSYRIIFKHPETNEILTFSADADFSL